MVFALAVSLVILGLITVVLLLVEIRQYRVGRHLISRRRFRLRLVVGALMLVLLAAVFVGIFLLRLTRAAANPALFMAFWSACVLVAVVLIWLMLADLREVGDRYTDRQHEIWRDMARFLANRGGQGKRGGPPARSEAQEPGDEQR